MVVSEQTSNEGSAVFCPSFWAITWSSVIDMLAPLAAVSGRTQDSQVAGLRAGTEPSEAAFSRLSNVVTYLLIGSNDESVCPSLKSAPLPVELQASTSLPYGVLFAMAP